jgi:hypothetical protein
MRGTYLGMFFRKGTFFVCNYFRIIHDTWHGAIPCHKMFSTNRELPLAEQSAPRYWRGVEEGTDLNL